MSKGTEVGFAMALSTTPIHSVLYEKIILVSERITVKQNVNLFASSIIASFAN